MITKKKRTYLKEQHKTYGSYNQNVRCDDEFMASKGHPYAKQYAQLRRFFDKLKYACNSGTRFFSMVDSNNFSEVNAPNLNVKWRAYRDINGEYFGEVYPAKQDLWSKYLSALSATNWEGSEASINIGYVCIHTDDDNFVSAIQSTEAGTKASNRDGCIQLFPKTYTQFYELIRLIRKFHKGNILPLRTFADDVSDKLAVPMSEKVVRLGNVSKVTVKEKDVLVPLIPIGTSHTSTTQLNIVNGLAECLKKGLKWSEAESHLASSLQAEHFAKLQAQYA